MRIPHERWGGINNFDIGCTGLVSNFQNSETRDVIEGYQMVPYNFQVLAKFSLCSIC